MFTSLIISAFILGLGGSLHCIGMCGPLAISLPFQSFSAFQRSIAVIFYHAGKISAYIFIGIIAGLVGRGVNWFGLTQVFSIVLGSVVVLSVFLPKLFNYKLPLFIVQIKQLQINSMQKLMKKKIT